MVLGHQEYSNINTCAPLPDTKWDAVSEKFSKIYYEKNSEYGDTDLKIMGRALQLAFRLESEEAGIEAAINFYILGKVSRAISANTRGERASSDTIMDTAIYAMMASMIRF